MQWFGLVGDILENVLSEEEQGQQIGAAKT